MLCQVEMQPHLVGGVCCEASATQQVGPPLCNSLCWRSGQVLAASKGVMQQNAFAVVPLLWSWSGGSLLTTKEAK